MGEDNLRVVRLGLVGVGAWGRRYVDTINRRRDCRIVAFARGSGRDDDAFKGIRRCATWTDLLELKSRGDLDGLIVATTPESQAEVAEAAIAHGVPVLVEKPLGLSVDTTRRILHKYQNATLKFPVVVDYVHLWAPAYRALKARVESSAAGVAGITNINSEGCNRGPFRTWSTLYDYGTHDLAMCLDLVGKATPFHLRTARRVSVAGNPDGAIFEASGDLGSVIVEIRVGNGASKRSREFSVGLSDGRRLVYDDVKPHPMKLLEQGTPVAIDVSPPLDWVVSHFLSLIKLSGGAGLPADTGGSSLELSVRVAEILRVIEESVKY